MDFMIRALDLAREALAAQEVPVGCVFTFEEKVVAESRNTVNESRNPTRHAEINCIDIVIDYCKTNSLNYIDFFKGIVVYVTVEPCIMCASALRDLNIKEVVYGCANDRFGGNTVVNLCDYYQGVLDFRGNVMATEAMAMLKTFYKGTNPNAPETKVKRKC
ncbi:tRNA-specific adenosine deaminase 2 [Aricia agestis]|uniref:tRNA-specific adenosine deaminase 2 n=1 Tax=Aricia agestis TaxID=91739 RepID=UPI001C202D19|nr:tRNA-specific adenosine deaminase 2 [Aricia agestis]